MIQTKLCSLSRMVENGPVSTAKDYSENKSQTKSKVLNLVKESDQKQAIKQSCLLNSVVQKGPPLSSNPKALGTQELVGRYIFLVDDKSAKNISEKTHKNEKKTQQETGLMFRTKCDNEDRSSDEDSESSVEIVEGHEVVLKTSSEKTSADDQDYLQLLEAHQQRLEEENSTNGFGNSDVHFVEGDQSAMYANGSVSYSYGDTNMFGQQQGAPAYMDGNQHQPTYTTAATTPTMVTGGNQGQFMQVHDTGMHGQGPHRPPITHTTRASPATVSWLLENYETSEGVSLPRSTLYNHYLQHCQSNKLDAVNAASFGKLIRSVFVGLRTRRLGTRGNSKYHYYGIRIKPTSPLNALVDPDVQGAMRQSPSSHKRIKSNTKMENESSDAEEQSRGNGNEDAQAQKSQQEQHQQYLGDISQGLPAFSPILVTEPLPEGITNADVVIFSRLYREHAEAILDVVVNLQFGVVESLWQTFWRAPSGASTTEAPIPESRNAGNIDVPFEQRLPKTKLTILCCYQPVLDFVKHSDYVLYQTLVATLIPEVLRPIPGSLTSAIRNYAKCLESWLVGSMTDIPQKMVDVKICTCSAFSQTLRRYTSLNHLAQAARAVLQNPQQINQMLTDLNRVDFVNVQEQASWVCQCDEEVVNQLETDFKDTLAQQNSLEKWAEWLEGVVNKVLLSEEGTPAYPKAARQFLLKWSFYSSMVIRDLTLRSAASFGSFHLIRLLYDEYMFYLIEHKVAAATGKSPIAVMGEFVGLGASLAAALGPLDSMRENGDGDSTSDEASDDIEEPCNGKDVKGSFKLKGSDEPESKKQRTS